MRLSHGSPHCLGDGSWGQFRGLSGGSELFEEGTAAEEAAVLQGTVWLRACLFGATVERMDARERRLVKNEIVFRDVNERIEEMASTQAQALRDQRDLGFLCECSNVDCTLRLQLSLGEYEEARLDPAQFVVAPGHELPEIEKVVFVGQGFQIVRKQGAAAAMAEEEDARRD